MARSSRTAGSSVACGIVAEADGTLGTVCIYQAVSPEAIRRHAQRVGMPADEITPVAATVIVRADPKEFAEAA